MLYRYFSLWGDLHAFRTGRRDLTPPRFAPNCPKTANLHGDLCGATCLGRSPSRFESLVANVLN